MLELKEVKIKIKQEQTSNKQMNRLTGKERKKRKKKKRGRQRAGRKEEEKKEKKRKQETRIEQLQKQ